MPNEDIGPSRQQYLEIKKQHHNTILFFRRGDFYETIDEDAEITSCELDVVLSSRSIGKGVRVPLARIPCHAVENYLARLIEKDYHVAICEQFGYTPIKGLFPRKVVHMVTPGTINKPGLLLRNLSNCLTAVIRDTSTLLRAGSQSASIAYVNITTGEFAVTELPVEALCVELTRLHSAEILHADNHPLNDGIHGHLTPYPMPRFELDKYTDALFAHLNTSTFDGFRLKHHSVYEVYC